MNISVTNISKARQGIRTPNGLVWLKPDETKSLNLDEQSHARVIELAELLRVGNGSEVKSIDEMLEGKGGDGLHGSLKDTFDAMTDVELSALYHDKFDKAPHHKAKRETIIAKLRGE